MTLLGHARPISSIPAEDTRTYICKGYVTMFDLFLDFMM